METTAARRRDPALAALYSAIVPGSGLLYAGERAAFVVVLVTEAILFALGWWVVFLPLHALQIAVSAGTAAVHGERGRDVFRLRRDGAVTDSTESPRPSS